LKKSTRLRLDYFKPALTMVEVCNMTSPEYLIGINVNRDSATNQAMKARFERRRRDVVNGGASSS